MRVTKEKAAENRTAILAAASRLFRKHGIDGVGIAEIAEAAGFTHGAVYAHFKSKDALVVEAFAYGFERNMDATRKWAADRDVSFDEHLAGLLSKPMRDGSEGGCPLAASASEAGRQGRVFSACFARTFEEMVAMIEKSIDQEMPASKRRSLAMSAVASQIGAIAVSRALMKADAGLADDVLKSMRDTMSRAYRAELARQR